MHTSVFPGWLAAILIAVALASPALAAPEPTQTSSAARLSEGPGPAATLQAPALRSSVGERLRSGIGLLVMLGLAWLLSTHRSRISWRLVGVGTGLQIGLGLLTQTQAGAWFFSRFNDVVGALLSYTAAGSSFIFGHVLTDPKTPGYLAFGVLPTIIFFSSLMAILYQIGLMQMVTKVLALVMQRTLGTSGAETLSAAGNIFVGQTEAPLLIRPFLKTMTQSELMAVMTGGFATVAGGVMVAYVGMLHPVFPEIAGHLLCASIMSAPAALVVAKIIYPEIDTPKTLGTVSVELDNEDVNLLDAAARGAQEGLQLCLNVGAMIIAFIALVAMLNGVMASASHAVGLSEPISLQQILGWLGAPLAWIMGVSWEDAPKIGSLLGMKTILNEFVAYLELSKSASDLSPRSMLIATYALCGFANLGSIGIQLGGIAPLAPERRSDLARIVFKAMLGGTLAAFMTACVIGMIL